MSTTGHTTAPAVVLPVGRCARLPLAALQRLTSPPSAAHKPGGLTSMPYLNAGPGRLVHAPSFFPPTSHELPQHVPTWIDAFGGVEFGVEGVTQQAMSQGENKGARLAAGAAIGNLARGAHSSMNQSIEDSKEKMKAAGESAKAGANTAGAANADNVGGQVAATEKAAKDVGSNNSDAPASGI